MEKFITVVGARENNLKNADVTIPRDKLVVFTGLSGSGKTSLAFDTIYAEGYRRFVESLSSYARQFLGQLDKPDVDRIDGLSPAISIDQKTTSRNPRSTVGTVTEIHDYLRLLYARVGVPHCPVCGKEIKGQTVDQIADRVLALPELTRILLLAPVVREKKGRHEKIFSDASKNGFSRVKVDGELRELDEAIELDKNKKHTVEIVVDRLVIKPGLAGRLSGSLETALGLSDGIVTIELADLDENDPGKYITMSQNYACEEHNISIGELAPRMFSFNNPYGACPECAGLGMKRVVSPERVIPDRSLSLRQGAIACSGFKSIDESTWTGKQLMKVGAAYGFTIDTPIEKLSPEQERVLLYGTEDKHLRRNRFNRPVLRPGEFMGVINIIQERFDAGDNEYYDQFLEEVPCPHCGGRRLKDEILSVTVGGLNIAELCELSVEKALEFVKNLRLTERERLIAAEVVKEIASRLEFLQRVGLEYLTLARGSAGLSGGEAQRIRLATQIGSSLMGVLYILDEPSIGLHQRDNKKLIDTLKRLRDAGNTVIVVEHDEETMLESDFIVDVGPGAGINGGRIVAAGTPQEIMDAPGSVTGDFLSGRRKIAVPEKRREPTGWLEILGAEEHNLKNIDVKIPLGCFVAVTGVSGSGKSSLINSILLNDLSKRLNRASAVRGKCRDVVGAEQLDKVIAIDQSPIGRTPRSNPATYTGMFTDIRAVFAKTPDARARGFGQDRFSFNVKGGRCEACQGDGTVKIEMNFLSDVYVKCEVCGGRRYNRETLEVKYKGKSIYDVLEMTVDEALPFFENIPSVRRRLATLKDVGLGYIKLGQSSTTLSGGEAQRVKLSQELSRRGTGRTIYILDEPTTGLHSADVEKLLEVLNRFADQHNTVVVIEHNLDVIKCADRIIDLGPEGGDRGGEVIFCGTPEECALCERSYTGQFLKKILYKADPAASHGASGASDKDKTRKEKDKERDENASS